MATKAYWFCCTFCNAPLCGCLSCTFVSLHFQYLLHRQADGIAPCSSNLLSCLGMSNRLWHDKMEWQKTLHSPKVARVYPHCSPGLNPLTHSQAWALSVLAGKSHPCHWSCTTHPEPGHRQTRFQNPLKNLFSFWRLKSAISRFFSRWFFLFILICLVSLFTYLSAAALFAGHRLIKFSIYPLSANQWKGSWNESKYSTPCV